MSLLLIIDTASAQASVSLSFNDQVLQTRTNAQMNDHAAWIHTAINDMLAATSGNYQLRHLAGVAIVGGPGSYTGLRVSMATAKGICYVLNIPLIILNTLKVMAYATNKENPTSQLLCPMIDARRMEVFTGLFNMKLEELITPCAMILDNHSFADWLENNEILFFGNGSQKFKSIVQHSNASFIDSRYTAQHLADLAYQAFSAQDFADLAYAEPIYLKEFYTASKLTG